MGSSGKDLEGAIIIVNIEASVLLVLYVLIIIILLK